jgi:transcriptional regulator with XRE-family HTH domain
MDKNTSEEQDKPARAAVRKDDSVALELVRARKMLGWSQAELHQRTGISRDTIKQYETGRHLPGARELRLLSAALGVSPNRLLLGSDEFQGEVSLLQEMMESAQGDELRMAYRFVFLNGMLTQAERNAVLTLIESILAGRKGGDKGLRETVAFIDEMSDVMAKLVAPVKEAMDKRAKEGTMGEVMENLRKASK